MSVRSLLTAFLIAITLGVGSPADEQPVDTGLSPADTVSISDSATRLPEVDEFVPVEIIAEMTYYEMPLYPRQAEQAGATGLVWVKALVSSKGEVLDAAIHRSSGNRYLDKAAVNAAPGCRFKPAIQGGKPVAMWVTYKVEFILDGRRAQPYSTKGSDLRVKSRVETVVWSLKGDSTTETILTKRQNPVSSGIGQQFGILILKETEDTRPGRQKAMVLIDGGCATGLKIGMTGAIWDDSGDDPVKLANVEVTDVQAFESLCMLESLRRRRVSLRNRVTFDIPPLSRAELLSRGVTYYESGMKEQALACFEAVSELANSNALVRARLDECRGAPSFDTLPKTPEDSTALCRRIPGWLTTAGAYIRLDKPDHARRLARKVLSIDSTSPGAQELLNALEAYDDCRIDLGRLFFGRGDTTQIERLPRIIICTSPEVPLPPFDYYDFPKKLRPHDTVWVRALVSSRGNVMKAELHRSCGLWELDWAAVESASETKFEPGISCGRPMAMWVKWKVVFWREKA